MPLEHERNYDLGMDALGTVCSWNTNEFGHGCSGNRMLLEHERNYDLGMDALGTVRSWNTNGIMIWAWMLWEGRIAFFSGCTAEAGRETHPACCSNVCLQHSSEKTMPFAASRSQVEVLLLE